VNCRALLEKMKKRRAAMEVPATTRSDDEYEIECE